MKSFFPNQIRRQEERWPSHMCLLPIMCAFSKSTLYTGENLISLVKAYPAPVPYWYSSYSEHNIRLQNWLAIYRNIGFIYSVLLQYKLQKMWQDKVEFNWPLAKIGLKCPVANCNFVHCYCAHLWWSYSHITRPYMPCLLIFQHSGLSSGLSK